MMRYTYHTSPFTPLKNGVHLPTSATSRKGRRWFPIFIGMIGLGLTIGCSATDNPANLPSGDGVQWSTTNEASKSLVFDSVSEISSEEFKSLVLGEGFVSSGFDPWIETGLRNEMTQLETKRTLASDGWLEVLRPNIIQGDSPARIVDQCKEYRFEKLAVFKKEMMSRPPKEYVLHAKFSPCVGNNLKTARRLSTLELLENKNYAKN